MTERVKISGFQRPGYVKDVAAYDTTPEAWDEVRNVRFNAIGATSFAGQFPVMSPAPFNPYWLKVFPPVENPLWVYGGTSKIYVFDGDHIDITRVSEDYTGSVAERWQGEVLNGVGVFNNTVDVPQMWLDFDASVRLQNLSNWPADLRCKFLRPFKNFLIAGHMIESGNPRPFRIRWSDAAIPGTVPGSWALNDPSVDAGEKDIAETSDYLVDGLTLGELFIVYKQRSVFAMQYIGRPDIFAHWPIIQGKGILWRDCVQPFQGGHFVAGIDDLYVHNGQRGSEQSIVEARLRNWIFNQIDANNYYNCYTVNYERKDEIWFCFPEAGEVFPTLAVVWNRITNGIGIRDIPSSPFIYPGPIIVNPDDAIWGDDTETFYRLTEGGDRRIIESGDTRVLE